MNSLFRVLTVAVASFGSISCVPVYADGAGPSGTANTVYFQRPISDVVDAISTGCVQNGFTVAESGSNYVVCAKPAKGGMLADLLVGGPYTYSTTGDIRYQVVPYGAGSAVQYTSYLESQTIDGPRRAPVNSNKNNAGIAAFLLSLGGTTGPQ